MKSSALSLFAAMIMAVPVHAADAADPNTALVRAMRSDVIGVSGARRAFLSGAVDEKFPRTDKKCVKRVSYEPFTAGFANVVGQVLRPAEIDSALKFYQSPAGVKFVEGTLRRLRKSFGEDAGIPEIAGEEDISPQQMAEIAEFTRSEVGHKVMGKELTESPAALKFGAEMLEQIARKCSRK